MTGLRALAAGAVLLTALLPVPTCPTPDPAGAPRLVDDGVVVAGDGSIPPGLTVSPFDDSHPAVALLEPGLRWAVRAAAAAAAAAGVEVRITSGWRSPELQQHFLDDAVAGYGSLAEARRWVAAPEVSRHVTGAAVDIGGPAAAEWMVRYGPRFGLCRVYANEWWHFERVAAPDGSCPPLLPDATAG